MDLLSLQSDPAAFRQSLLIDTDSGRRPLAEVDDWQARDFTALDGGWQRMIGQQADGEPFLRAWLERPRGHSKSSDAMAMATWALFASRKRLSGIVCAVDRDQAGLDREHLARLVAINPWLDAVLDVQQWRIINKHTGSALDIIASDEASSYGLLIDFAICDEVTVWPKRGMFDSIFSAVAKRSTALLLCIGNAGFRDSWQWPLRESIRTDARWYFSRQEGPVASWLTQANLDEQRRLLPSAAYDRLWLNLWSAAGGDALSEADIEAAFRAELRPLSSARESPGYNFVAAADAGVSRDASAIVVLGVRRSHAGHGLIRLAHTRIWRPSKSKKVDLGEVEAALVDLHARFNLQRVFLDPWELRYLGSRLQSGGLGKIGDPKSSLPIVEIPPTGSNLQRMATAMLEAFADRRLELYADADLKRDLNRMRVVEKSYGFRIESPRDASGHGDMGSAFILALLAASELAAKKKVVAGALNARDDDNPMSSFERALQQAADHEVIFDQEQAEWRQGEDHQAEFREAMRATGRLNNPFF